MVYFFALSRARFLTKIKPNSAHIFPCYCIKQLDSMLLCVCSVIDHRRRQNAVRTKKWPISTQCDRAVNW